MLLVFPQTGQQLTLLLQAYEQMAELEKEADQVLTMQSRLELANNERDAAIAKAEGLTPRPGVKAFEGLTPEGTAKLDEALALHRCLAKLV